MYIILDFIHKSEQCKETLVEKKSPKCIEPFCAVLLTKGQTKVSDHITSFAKVKIELCKEALIYARMHHIDRYLNVWGWRVGGGANILGGKQPNLEAQMLT